MSKRKFIEKSFKTVMQMVVVLVVCVAMAVTNSKYMAVEHTNAEKKILVNGRKMDYVSMSEFGDINYYFVGDSDTAVLTLEGFNDANLFSVEGEIVNPCADGVSYDLDIGACYELRQLEEQYYLVILDSVFGGYIPDDAVNFTRGPFGRLDEVNLRKNTWYVGYHELFTCYIDPENPGDVSISPSPIFEMVRTGDTGGVLHYVHGEHCGNDRKDVNFSVFDPIPHISEDNLSLKIGDKKDLNVSLFDRFQVVSQSSDPFIWTSSNPDVVTVSGDMNLGEITAVGVGEATITATPLVNRSYALTCNVTVSDDGTISI